MRELEHWQGQLLVLVIIVSVLTFASQSQNISLLH
jgi:hypothetical protein